MKVDGRKLWSRQLRDVNFQGDALRLRMNWTEEDLGKPQVLVLTGQRPFSPVDVVEEPERDSA